MKSPADPNLELYLHLFSHFISYSLILGCLRSTKVPLESKGHLKAGSRATDGSLECGTLLAATA